MMEAIIIDTTDEKSILKDIPKDATICMTNEDGQSPTFHLGHDKIAIARLSDPTNKLIGIGFYPMIDKDTYIPNAGFNIVFSGENSTSTIEALVHHLTAIDKDLK